MTAYQFSQSWLSKLNDPNYAPTALEFAHIRDYLKGIDNGTVSLFNPNFLNMQINGTSLSLPVSVANGGTNSTTSLANGLLMVSSGGKIVEIGGNVSAGSHKITSLANGTTSTDAAAFGQLKVIQITTGTSTTNFSTTSSTYQTTNLSASITPTSTSNKVLIIAASNLEIDGSTKLARVTLARGGSNILATNGQFSVQSVASAENDPFTIVFLDSPSSTSSLTYAVQVLSSDNTTTVQVPGSTTTQFMVLAEVAP